MNSSLVVLLLIGFVVGIGVGFLLGIFVYDHAFTKGARFERTGKIAKGRAKTATILPGVGPPIPDGARPAGPRGEASGASVEWQASQAALERVVERGALQYMEMDDSLTIEDARERARQALRNAGAFSMSGGIPAP